MMFEWDLAKNAANITKHGIDFEDAIGVFEGAVLEVRSDRGSEKRWKAVGEIEGVVIAVVFTWREDRRRIISARKARNNERRAYRAAQRRGPSEGEDRLG